jgi:SNF2 family DNA or RNA helicase
MDIDALGNNGLLGRLYDTIGVSYITVPNLDQLLRDSGKLRALDRLLTELKAGGHRALIYCQMTKMIDILEEYMAFRNHKYLRLDGSSKLEDRRDMVEDWQTQYVVVFCASSIAQRQVLTTTTTTNIINRHRPELFVFLLSTRAGGLGINLTAADTVIFYDSDWNPTMDAQV